MNDSIILCQSAKSDLLPLVDSHEDDLASLCFDLGIEPFVISPNMPFLSKILILLRFLL